MRDILQEIPATRLSIARLSEGLAALAKGMDTLLERMTALECEMRDIKAYVLTKLPEKEGV